MSYSPTSFLTLALCAFTALSPLRAADDWPQFRGPGGQGHSSGNLPLTWSESENVTWKTALPGRGWSSPVIAEGRIWMTTAIERPAAQGKRRDRKSARPNLRALCLDQKTGKVLHNIDLLSPDKLEAIHTLNSYASPTPVVHKSRVYMHFGTFGTVCLDAKTGKRLWSNTSLNIRHDVGPGSSPIIWEDKLIFHCDGMNAQYIVALDTRTGTLAWKTDRSGKMNAVPDMKKAFGTPLVATIHGKPQLLSPAANWLYAYDPASGKELWKVSYEKLGYSTVPRPVVGHGMIYFATSFNQSDLIAVRYENKDGNCDPHIAWRYTKGAPQQPSPLLVGDELYIVNDRTGIATCLNAHTGKELWKQRLGGSYSASPLHTNGRLYFSNREGQTTVLQAGKKAKVLATNTIEGKHMASAAVSKNTLFLRTDTALYRIDNK